MDARVLFRKTHWGPTGKPVHIAPLSGVGIEAKHDLQAFSPLSSFHLSSAASSSPPWNLPTRRRKCTDKCFGGPSTGKHGPVTPHGAIQTTFLSILLERSTDIVANLRRQSPHQRRAPSQTPRCSHRRHLFATFTRYGCTSSSSSNSSRFTHQFILAETRPYLVCSMAFNYKRFQARSGSCRFFTGPRRCR